MTSVAVFCGSKMGRPQDQKMATMLGEYLATHHHQLIYGGASVGIMNAVAEGTLSKGGTVIGIMPKVLVDMEVSHKRLTKLHAVSNMHERKQMMYDLSDLFIAIPGGMGTLDEFCEIVTWHQIGIHKKKCILFNFDGFYDHFVAHLKQVTDAGFMHENAMRAIIVVNTLEELYANLSV